MSNLSLAVLDVQDLPEELWLCNTLWIKVTKVSGKTICRCSVEALVSKIENVTTNMKSSILMQRTAVLVDLSDLVEFPSSAYLLTFFWVFWFSPAFNTLVYVPCKCWASKSNINLWSWVEEMIVHLILSSLMEVSWNYPNLIPCQAAGSCARAFLSIHYWTSLMLAQLIEEAFTWTRMNFLRARVNLNDSRNGAQCWFTCSSERFVSISSYWKHVLQFRTIPEVPSGQM